MLKYAVGRCHYTLLDEEPVGKTVLVKCYNLPRLNFSNEFCPYRIKSTRLTGHRIATLVCFADT